MTCCASIRPLIRLAVGVAAAAAASMLAGSAAPTAGPIIDLPAKARQEIERYLGKGVVGRAIEAPIIDDPATFMGLDGQQVLRVKVVHGKMAGKTRDITISRLDRRDPQPAWRLDAGDDAWFGEVDARGSFVQYSTQEAKHGVISRYAPPQPILLRGMRPGESREMRIEVSVFDLARPDRKKHSGYLDLTYTYVGAYEVTVPAGTFETVLFSWRYDGKVGPARVKDNQYWFFADGLGPVARINMKDISAMLVYRDTSKVAGVLVERR